MTSNQNQFCYQMWLWMENKKWAKYSMILTDNWLRIQQFGFEKIKEKDVFGLEVCEWKINSCQIDQFEIF
jgi:hypothetical protein